MDNMPSPPRTQLRLAKRKRDDANGDDDEETLFVSPDVDTKIDTKADAAEDFERPSDVEDEDDEEFDDEDETYNESSEPLPNHPYYDADVAVIENQCRTMVAGVHQILVQSSCDTEAVQAFREKAVVLEKPQEIQPIQVGLLGESGAGKSSTTNSLLDTPGLALEGDACEACTCVVAETRQPFPVQETEVAAKIHFLDQASMRDMLHEQLNNYHLFHFSEDARWEPRDHKHYNNRADTAIDTFRALFCLRNEFQSNNEATRFLKTRKDNIESTVATMLEWCKELLLARGGKFDHQGHYEEYYEDDSMVALNEVIEPLITQTRRKDRPALWPLVQKACIGKKGSRVLFSISLADLPGVSDINTNRVRAAIEYLKVCDAIWLVGRIDRIISDDNVNALLMKYGERFPGKIALIVTRCDDISDYAKVAKAMEDHGCGFGDLKTQLTSFYEASKNAEKIKKLYESACEPKKRRLLEKKDKWTSRKNEMETRCLRRLVDIRNRHVTDQLMEKKSQYVQEGTQLRIFCLSNKHYAALKGTAVLETPLLTAQGTGVPELRRYAVELSAPALMQNLDNYVNHLCPVFMKGMELWAHGTRVKSPDDIRKIVARPQIAFHSMLQEYLAGIKNGVEKLIVSRTRKHLGDLSDRATAHLVSWEGRNWCSLKAFVSNNGNWSTSLVPEESWDKNFSKAVTEMVIEPSWHKLGRSQNDKQLEMVTTLNAMVINIVTDLESKYNFADAEL
ncbi:hypothetical protein LTR37_015412 [Vermiconidia calcicola]|uniref:Uncharacterized protein n=1 Tax=Vermiconidia calcicola TaxID=1690605 RepID=A0ACC3MRL5_9PEZI|nr:hypothetical protein LTR37_015412 [Vermiconidia calcicola]